MFFYQNTRLFPKQQAKTRRFACLEGFLDLWQSVKNFFFDRRKPGALE